MHLNAVQAKPNKNKKVKIDLSDPNYEIRWNANLVLKIITIGRKQWEECAQKHTIDQLRELEDIENANEEAVLLEEKKQQL